MLNHQVLCGVSNLCNPEVLQAVHFSWVGHGLRVDKTLLRDSQQLLHLQNTGSPESQFQKKVSQVRPLFHLSSM